MTNDKTPDGIDSLKKRYSYKLFANAGGSVINMIAQAIVPRGLGPKAYGDFNFLNNFFVQLMSFVEMGTSLGFYTKLSQRPKEPGLVPFYAYFACIVSLGIMGVFSLTTMFPRLHNWLWPGQRFYYVSLAVVLGMLTWIVGVLNKMADAYGITVSAEKARMLQKILGLILILILYGVRRLNLANFFFYQYFILLFLGLAFLYIIEREGYSLKRHWNLSSGQITKYLKEFYHYSHPLVVYAAIGLIVNLLDRWLLQFYGGSIQQGFFGLSYQIGAACLLFTSAMTPLLTREFSIASGKKNLAHMARLFRRYIPLLYSIAAYLSCFISAQANKVIYIFGGTQYKEAIMAVSVMAFYPIHQTYGQLSGSVFYATGQTRLYRNIGIFFMLLGLPLVYFMIAPADRMGLNSGALGLAIKMVFINFAWVNVQLYYNTRFLKISFLKYFAHQIVAVVFLSSCAFISKFAADIIFGSKYIIAAFLLAGCLYTLIVGGLLFFFPILFGLNAGDIHYVISRLVPGRREMH